MDNVSAVTAPLTLGSQGLLPDVRWYFQNALLLQRNQKYSCSGKQIQQNKILPS